MTAYVPLLVLDRDVFRHVAAYVPLLALDRDVFRHVPAYDPLLALDRDVFRHVPAYDRFPVPTTGIVAAMWASIVSISAHDV